MREVGVNTALFFAIQYDLVDKVRSLIRDGSDVNFVTKRGDTPLLMALKLYRNDISIMLIKSGADINKKDGYGITPIHICIDVFNIPMIEMLINQGANLNVTWNDLTPLALACKHQNEQIVDYLLGHGAHITDVAIIHAFKVDNEVIMNSLLRAGGHISVSALQICASIQEKKRNKNMLYQLEIILILTWCNHPNNILKCIPEEIWVGVFEMMH